MVTESWEAFFLGQVGAAAALGGLIFVAVSLNLTEVRTHKLLAILVLGPGTLLSAALTAGAAHWILGLTVPMALILASALASNDPVLLRGVLKPVFREDYLAVDRVLWV